MRPYFLALLAGATLLSSLPRSGACAPPAAGPSPAAIAAVPLDTEVPAALGARFQALLPAQLGRAGFTVLDPRLVDLKLAEHPDVDVSCQRESCLLTQAQVLGVGRLIVPRLAPLRGGVGLALALWEVTPGPRLSRTGEAVEECLPCQGEALDQAVGRVTEGLRRSALRARNGEVRVRPVPADATVLVDGSPVGAGEVRVVLPPGAHVLAAQSRLGRGEKHITLEPRGQVEVDLWAEGQEPAPPPLAVRPGHPLRTAKWVVGGLGLAALIIGTTLWALDGTPHCDRVVGQTHCPEVLDSQKPGIALFSIGAAGLVTSAVLFAVDRQKEPAPAVAQVELRF